MKKRLLSIMVVVSLAVTMLTGCGEKRKSEENTAITMASNPFVGLAPVYVAMDKGFFEECGIDFFMVDFDDSTSSCSALLANKVDLAYVTLDAAIIAESQNQEDMLKVTSVIDESAGADGILVKNDITSIADLKGKTIGVSINQTSHYLLHQALEEEGLTDSDVNLVNMTSSDAGVSFIGGALDAAVTWEPYLSNAVNEGAGKMIFSSADAPGAIVDVIAVGTENQDAEWLESVNKAIQMGLDYLNNETTHEEAVKIISNHLEVEPDEVESMLSTIKLYGNNESKEAMQESGLLYSAIKDISEFYLNKEIIENNVEPSELLSK